MFEQPQTFSPAYDSAELLAAFFKHAPVACGLFTADGRSVATNPAFQRLFGAGAPGRLSLFDDVGGRAWGWAEAAQRALAGQTVRMPAEWYLAKELPWARLRSSRVALSLTFFAVGARDGPGAHLAIVFEDVTGELAAAERARLAFTESEERYRTFIHRSTEGIWRLDLDTPIDTRLPVEEQIQRVYERGYLAECNDAFARGYGLADASLLVGKRVPELLDRSDPTNLEYLRTFITHGYRLEDADSREVDAQGRLKIMRNMWVGVLEDGLLIRAWGIQRDVTQQVLADADRHAAELRADAERRRFLDVLMRLPASISVRRGPEQVFELVNPTYQALAGTRRLIGLPIRQALPELSGHPILQKLDEAFRTGEPFSGKEVQIPRCEANAPELFLDITYLPLRDENGQVDSVVSFGVDVTQEVRTRRQLEAMTRDLRANVDERRQHAAQLEEAVRVRDVFLSVASHELKTPLTPLSLKLEVLRRAAERQPDNPLTPIILSSTEVGHRQVRKLSELVGDLLDVSRISQRRFRFELEPVDLSTVVQEVASRYQSESPEGRRLRVWAERQVIGKWNRLRLEQVVTNLVDNALKYGAGNPVEVRVQAIGGRARLEVVDHGIGIAPEVQGRIFERFERAVSERHYGGLGLGLYITREIVRSLGGQVGVKSQPGQETRFTVELPFHPPAVHPSTSL